MIDELHAVFYKSLLNGYESHPGPPSDAMIVIITSQLKTIIWRISFKHLFFIELTIINVSLMNTNLTL